MFFYTKESYVSLPFILTYVAECIGSNGSRNGSQCDSPIKLLAVSPKHFRSMSIPVELKRPEVQTDTFFPKTVIDSPVKCGPQFMQVVNLQPCTATTSSSSVADMKALRLVCSEQGTLPHALGSTYGTLEMKPGTTDATIILCTSDYPPDVYPVSLHNSVPTDSQKIVSNSLQTPIDQSMTVINYTHPTEVQHLCIHPPQVRILKFSGHSEWNKASTFSKVHIGLKTTKLSWK